MWAARNLTRRRASVLARRRRSSRLDVLARLSGALVDEQRALVAPSASVEARLAIARKISEGASESENLLAVVVVGSTALRRSSPRSDLDIVFIERSLGLSSRFESREICGVHVEIERITSDQALTLTADGGWIWDLRNAARLGSGVAILDPEGFASGLAHRAASIGPRADRVEATLEGIYVTLSHLGRGLGDEVSRSEALRGCLDNLAVLILLERPRRYQKAKWTLADLLDAGEATLAGATLWAYGVHRGSEASSRIVLARAREFIEAVHAQCDVPSHDEILASGYAPTFLEASYVSRCLADASDLAELGCFLEAQYVAKFAVRLAAGQLAAKSSPGSLMEALSLSNGMLEGRYLQLFPVTSSAEGTVLEIALQSAENIRQAFMRRVSFADAGAST